MKTLIVSGEDCDRGSLAKICFELDLATHDSARDDFHGAILAGTTGAALSTVQTPSVVSH